MFIPSHPIPSRSGWDERGKLPGVFFFYDVSPIMVHYTETKTPFYHFLTEICAIVGGAITVTGCAKPGFPAVVGPHSDRTSSR
eukprot:SAG22_NODE_12238_length_451_cov_0.579545_1_plen_82_part_10